MSASAEAPPGGVSLLYVATVSATLRHFMPPFAERFRTRGWRVDAAARGATSDRVLRAAFTDVHEVPLSRSVRDVAGIVRAYRVIASLVSSGYDIVHVHSPIAGFLTRLAASRIPAARRPVVVYTAHGFHFHRQGRLVTNLAFLAAERLAGRWTDRLIVINDEDHEAARRYRVAPWARVVRMSGIGLDTDLFSPQSVRATDLRAARHRLGIDPDAPMFVSIGELNANKRHADAIRALAGMRRRDAHLVVLGEGSARGRLEQLAARLGVEDRIHLPGFVTDVRPLLAGATALVHPSKREGLSRSVMEALALEIPVISSTARGNEELVRDSGVVVGIGDVPGLTDAMDQLADDPVERSAMGRRGRARMVADYDLRHVIAHHEQVYRELLSARSRSG